MIISKRFDTTMNRKSLKLCLLLSKRFFESNTTNANGILKRSYKKKKLGLLKKEREREGNANKS